MSKSPQDDFSDEFDDSEEEDFNPKPKTRRPTKSTNHKRPSKNNEKVINLGSVSNGGTKKKSTKRPVSAGVIKKANRPAVEYWNDSLRRGGPGLTTQTTAYNTMTGLNKKQRKDMAYSSTSHFLRQMAGTEKPKRPASPAPRAAPGTPAYKSPEEYYDEIIDLKKQISNLNQDNSQMKSKMRRLEEDNLKKEREIEQLLDPTKSEELRRTLADRKPDAGVVIHSLKQKILKLEHQLKDREAAHSRLQAELKTTKIEEMKLQVETFYKEIVRLNQLKSVDVPRNSRHGREEPVKENNNAKLKALQETILRMNEKSFRLTAENKTLKTDLEKTLDDLAKAKDKLKRGHSDHEDKRGRKSDRYDADTISLMSEIESRHGDTEGKMAIEGTLAQRLDQLDRRETELLEDADKQRKIIKQLKEDRGHYRKKAEEKEKEIKTLRKDIESSTAQFESDRRHPTSRSSVTPRNTVPVSNAAPDLTPRRGSRSGRGNRSRSPSVSSDKGSRYDDRKSQRELDDEERWRHESDAKAEAFRQKRSVRKIEKSWISHRNRKLDSDLDDTTEFLQSTFRGHLSRRNQMEAYRNRPPSRGSSNYEEDEGTVTESDLDSAAELLQSNMRGHLSRKEQLRKSRLEDSDSELDEAISSVQSAFRAHLFRKTHLEKQSLRDAEEQLYYEEQEHSLELIQSAFKGHLGRKVILENYNIRTASRSPASSRRGSAHYRQRLDSAGEEEDEDDKQPYLSRASKRPTGRDSSLNLKKPPASPRKFSMSSRRDENEEDDDDDDSDDDVIVTSSRRR